MTDLRATATLRTSGLTLVVLLQWACAASSEPAATRDDAPDSRVVVLDVGVAETEVGDVPRADVPPVCKDRCAKDIPIVPQCMVTSWDIKTCTCSLRPALDGTACEDGVDCTAQDQCIAGGCTGGPSADLVEPPDGMAAGGDSFSWSRTTLRGSGSRSIWTRSCRACDGSRAYLSWLSTGLGDQVPHGPDSD
jgi:hypothetical protein